MDFPFVHTLPQRAASSLCLSIPVHVLAHSFGPSQFLALGCCLDVRFSSIDVVGCRGLYAILVRHDAEFDTKTK